MGKYLEVVMPLVFLFYSLYAVYKKIKRKKEIMQAKQIAGLQAEGATCTYLGE